MVLLTTSGGLSVDLTKKKFIIFIVKFAHDDNTYRKVPKCSNARNCCNLPKIQTKRPNLKVFCQKHANGIANSEDPESSLIWVCTVCPDLSVQKFRIITI